MTIVQQVQERYRLAGLDAREAEVFLRAYGRYLGGERAVVEWERISSPSASDLVSHESLEKADYAARTSLGIVAWVVLNGGLGTTMKMTRAKSLLKVKGGLSFLDLLARHVRILERRHGAAVPLVFMNSFATHDDTMKAIGSYNLSVVGPDGPLPSYFVQNRFPRVMEDGTGFFGEPSDPASWAPPGHGDIYESINISGVLGKLLRAGRKFLFVSNADNLGATPDPHILGYLEERKIPFALEVTPRTAADVKGGTIVRHCGNLELLELAQVDPAHAASFQDIRKFSVFNTNSLWINLEMLQKRIGEGHLDLPLIINRKIVSGTAVVQLETAMGSAIGAFPGSVAVVVGRDRFAPVKTTNDFLLRRSDLYVEGEKSPLEPSTLRDFALGQPLVDLDPVYFGAVDDLDDRIPHELSLVEAVSLKVRGDVRFGRGVKIRGAVSVENNSGSPLVIPDGSVLEGA